MLTTTAFLPVINYWVSCLRFYETINWTVFWLMIVFILSFFAMVYKNNSGQQESIDKTHADILRNQDIMDIKLNIINENLRSITEDTAAIRMRCYNEKQKIDDKGNILLSRTTELTTQMMWDNPQRIQEELKKQEN